MSIGAAIGAGIAGSIGNAIGNAIGGAFSGGSSSSGKGNSTGNHGQSPGALGGRQAPGGGYGGIGNGTSSGGGASNAGRGGFGSSIVSAVGQGLGSAISGFGSAYANAAYNSVGQSAQGQFNALAGVDAQGGRNARDFMQNLYGPDVSPWDWLQGNANNQGSIQASQQSEDRNKLKVSERIVDKQNATQRYVSDNALKATQYASDSTYKGVERVQEDPFRTNLLMAQAAESRIRTKFDEANIEVAKQDAILRQFQTYMTKAMTDNYKEQAMATGDANLRDWHKLPKELAWLDQQTLTSEQQRTMLEVGNWWQTMRTVLPKINLFGWEPFANGDDGTQALADLFTITFGGAAIGTAAKGSGPLMRAGQKVSTSAKAFMQAYQLARKQGKGHLQAMKAGADYIIGKPAVVR